jgi:S-formylglutathione hydrolase FrmB
MAFFDCHFFSDTLAMTVSAYVLVPQSSMKQIGLESGPTRNTYPTLYLLHGLSDDHTIWMRRTSIERYATAKNIAVVMPAVARSFYQNMASGPQYWTFLSEELPRLMRQFFPLSAAREDNFAAGLSMGGYGALRLGLAHPERFAAAASMSGALDYVGRLQTAGKPGSRVSLAEWQGVAGVDMQAGDGDLRVLADQVVQTGNRPELWIDCGTEDELLPDSRDFHAHLDRLNYRHHYEEKPGLHDWRYWDGQIQRVLDWLPVRK